MERGETGKPRRTQRRRRLVLLLVAALLLVVIVAVAVGVSLRQQPHQEEFKDTFINRCKEFKGDNCSGIWEAFQQAYVNRDPCDVPVEAYDPLIAAAPFKPECNRMMFWSKTKDVVHDFTEKKDCFVTLEDTLLGEVLDGLTWCGKKDSSETFTSGCPGWSDCVDNPVRSFWNRVSAAYADVACGDVTAMLSGSIETPFSPGSIFRTVELKRFDSSRVNTLTVVLVTQEEKVANCTNDSLKDLQMELQKGIRYNCKEVPESQISACSSDPTASCGSCW
ncbi:ADP-ribosyl cyclase/cyclic ADP-ribose hydrolase 1-like [Salarias fasciatus]|uniref:ADP-ribosyl cyclase/cyclic ADP-ribose hydrolase n=1 Tax=Salarias fasciatus TaxID=181472 RepID=A0A672J9K4_SALFA|nr:ADP-ribosyl cyclase/cyclic ADP-ribose hydrolase 1-like [Salarias fasciatus]